MDILITNNLLVKDAYAARFEVKLIEGGLPEVLRCVRDHLHRGHRLLTHPLSGSVKPGETPFKSVLVSGGRGEPDVRSLGILEQSILAAASFAPRTVIEAHLPDLRQVDLALIAPALERR